MYDITFLRPQSYGTLVRTRKTGMSLVSSFSVCGVDFRKKMPLTQLTLKSRHFFPVPGCFVLWLKIDICETDRTTLALCHRHLLKGYIQGRKSGHSTPGTAGISASTNGKTRKGLAAQHCGGRDRKGSLQGYRCWQRTVVNVPALY